MSLKNFLKQSKVINSYIGFYVEHGVNPLNMKGKYNINSYILKKGEGVNPLNMKGKYNKEIYEPFQVDADKMMKELGDNI